MDQTKFVCHIKKLVKSFNPPLHSSSHSSVCGFKWKPQNTQQTHCWIGSISRQLWGTQTYKGRNSLSNSTVVSERFKRRKQHVDVGNRYFSFDCICELPTTTTIAPSSSSCRHSPLFVEVVARDGNENSRNYHSA